MFVGSNNMSDCNKRATYDHIQAQPNGAAHWAGQSPQSGWSALCPATMTGPASPSATHASPSAGNDTAVSSSPSATPASPSATPATSPSATPATSPSVAATPSGAYHAIPDLDTLKKAVDCYMLASDGGNCTSCVLDYLT